MTNHKSLLFVLCCWGGAICAAGCSQGPWGMGKPASQEASTNSEVGGPPVGGVDLSATGTKTDDSKMPKNPLALARLSERRGQIDQAERLYQEVIKKTPKNSEPYHRLAVMYAKRGKMAQAEENFTRALALKSDDPEILSDAGYFYYLTGRSQQAEQHLRRAMDLEPGNKKYCTNFALVLGEQGRTEEAYNLFRRVGSETQATANLAFVLSQRGEYQKAIELYDRVLTDDPTMRVAADAMIELSNRTSRKPVVPPSAAPADGRSNLAASSSPTSRNANNSAAAAQSLVTITEGRPVDAALPPPEDPVRSRPAPPAEVACAYVAPSNPAPTNPTPSNPAPASDVPAAHVPASIPSPLPPLAGSQPPHHGAVPIQETSLKAPLQESPVPVPVTPSWRRPETLGLAAVAGVLLAGVGAIPLVRRRRLPRRSHVEIRAPHAEKRGSKLVLPRQRGVVVRTRPARRPTASRRSGS